MTVRSFRRPLSAITGALSEAGFAFSVPEGAYYILADFSALSDMDDVTFAKWMAQEVGVATVPGSSFYHDRELGRTMVRFAFCKKFETLRRAADRLVEIRQRV